MSHKAAAITIVAASALDAAGGVVFSEVEHRSLLDGFYWALTTATTVGYGDITPHTAAGKAVAMVVMATVVPLFAASFSLFTTALTAVHVRRAEGRIKDHVQQLHEVSGCDTV